MEIKKQEQLSRDPVMMMEVNKINVVDQPMPEMDPYTRSLLFSSIQLFGIKEPIRIDSESNVLVGRTRLEIAKDLKHKYVPCVISDTENNPKESVLKYDMEIFRRNLTPEEQSKLTIERNKYAQQLDDHFFNKYLKEIIPELRDNVKRVFELTGDFGFLKQIASKATDIQKELINEVQVVLDENLEGTIGDELKRLATSEKKLSRELKSIKHGHTKLVDSLKEKEEMLTILQIGMKKQIADRIAKKEKEFKEKYSSTAPDEVKKLLQEERQNVLTEFNDEISNLNNDLKEMSLTVQDKSNKLEQLNEELKDIKQAKSDIEAAKKNTDNHLKEMKTVIEGLARPQKFVTRLEGTLNDINNTFQGLVEVGIEAFNTEHRKLMEKLLEQINTVSLELNDLLRSGDKVKSANGNGKKKTKK